MPTPMSRVQLETTLRMSVPTDMLITETWLIPTVASLMMTSLMMAREVKSQTGIMITAIV
jgi:hypothetical protein